LKNLRLLDLQLFAEGGDGSTTSSSGSGASTSDGSAELQGIANPKKGRSNPLANVVYGKQTEEIANPTVSNETNGENTRTPKDMTLDFENLIKGEYKEAFNSRVQEILNKRFKDNSEMAETMKHQASILKMVSDKYGVDATDLQALEKAVADDESYYEQEALERGLSVEQLKEVKALERDNAELRAAEEARAKEERSDQIYREWLEEGQQFAQRYGLTNFDFNEEVQNPDFTRLLGSGVGVEAAYKAIHFDDMVGGAMATTAENVKAKLTQNVAARASRPSENGVMSHNTVQFKTDVNSLTKADRQEILKRVARGEDISF